MTRQRHDRIFFRAFPLFSSHLQSTTRNNRMANRKSWRVHFTCLCVCEPIRVVIMWTSRRQIFHNSTEKSIDYIWEHRGSCNLSHLITAIIIIRKKEVFYVRFFFVIRVLTYIPFCSVILVIPGFRNEKRQSLLDRLIHITRAVGGVLAEVCLLILWK